MAQERKDLIPPYGYLTHLFRRFPDFDPPFIRLVRQKAVDLLHLKAGDRVLDVGCGPGSSSSLVSSSGAGITERTHLVVTTNASRLQVGVEGVTENELERTAKSGITAGMATTELDLTMRHCKLV